MAVKSITPFLWFDSNAEEAAEFYVSLFPNSRVTHVSRYGEAGPAQAGSAMVVGFELQGQRFTALNGGPTYKLTEAFSLLVECDGSAGDRPAVGRVWRRRLLQFVRLAEGPLRAVLADQLCGPARDNERKTAKPGA